MWWCLDLRIDAAGNLNAYVCDGYRREWSGNEWQMSVISMKFHLDVLFSSFLG